MGQIINMPVKAVKIEIADGMKIVPAATHGNNESLLGRTWTMDMLRTWCGNKSTDWLKKYILENPRYSREMAAMEQKGQLIHKGRGSVWRFKASAMAEFLDRHWEEFPW